MKASGCLWNALTVLFVALTVMACVWVGAVFINPQGRFNPLRPVRPSPHASTPEPAPIGTAIDPELFPTLPPEWTATFTPPAATPTRTTTPTVTLTPEASATVLLSPVGPTATQSETPEATATRTVRPPAASNTPRSYPPTEGGPTETPGGYP